jgi:hypothetical protein
MLLGLWLTTSSVMMRMSRMCRFDEIAKSSGVRRPD